MHHISSIKNVQKCFVCEVCCLIFCLQNWMNLLLIHYGAYVFKIWHTYETFEDNHLVFVKKNLTVLIENQIMRENKILMDRFLITSSRSISLKIISYSPSSSDFNYTYFIPLLDTCFIHRINLMCVT